MMDARTFREVKERSGKRVKRALYIARRPDWFEAVVLNVVKNKARRQAKRHPERIDVGIARSAIYTAVYGTYGLTHYERAARRELRHAVDTMLAGLAGTGEVRLLGHKVLPAAVDIAPGARMVFKAAPGISGVMTRGA